MRIFPAHPALPVDFCTFAFIFLITGISTDLAFNIQYLILVIILLSLLCIGMGFLNHPLNMEVQWIGLFEGSPPNLPALN